MLFFKNLGESYVYPRTFSVLILNLLSVVILVNHLDAVIFLESILVSVLTAFVLSLACLDN